MLTHTNVQPSTFLVVCDNLDLKIYNIILSLYIADFNNFSICEGSYHKTAEGFWRCKRECDYQNVANENVDYLDLEEVL